MSKEAAQCRMEASFHEKISDLIKHTRLSKSQILKEVMRLGVHEFERIHGSVELVEVVLPDGDHRLIPLPSINDGRAKR